MRRFIAAFAVLLAAAAEAADHEDLDALDARIAVSLGGTRSAQPVDRRIKLARCPQPVEISPPMAGAVAARCPPLGWRLRVPMSGGPVDAGPAEILVHRGQTISLVDRGGGYIVSATGTALDEGRAGAMIHVRIATSPHSL